MVLKIYDSIKKQKVEFIPIDKHKVKIYVCGPTVYDHSHLGHARSAIAFDLLVRVLKEMGYEVLFVKNFTDIDDKIITKAKALGITIEELTQTYTQAYLEEMQALGIVRADIEPKATESLEVIFEMISILLQKGYAYQTPQGDIYLSVQKDKLYGTLSKRELDAQSQSRLAQNDQKHQSQDFALWKSYKGEDDIGYESPFGRGRPGWHIECSSMIKKHLAYEGEYSIDIHCGGADLLFPHHENEASQTRCAYDQELAKYWMHNGFVTINGEKMSKSLGNSFFIKDALQYYDGEILRFYLLGAHYRTRLNFAEEDLLSAKKRLDKLYRLKKRVFQTNVPTQEHPSFYQDFLDALMDDLNIAKVLSIVDEFILRSNEHLDAKNKAEIGKILGALELIGRVLGIGLKNPYDYFQLGVSKEEKEQIEELISQRMQAKRQKDFALADHLRRNLQQMGIEVMDTKEGCMWEKV